ncbi:hypothetical protein DICPUDRAFT_97940 [Dictyostelium purpureum]|uniref:Atg6 BARA domain-containing protein n=1 Tax=Dictyostelium purpureum TaxID=5786 RepID=F0ZL83_DICPU|nr:uncharacterized protein DICPUDRAFT_97940 [Dictyostelium purpureum]EGC35303.1 hypothetical protein DICPUDRAFT_97940 [Dictyostelium purpureum]|eukprot:XP_003288170.1 hypothetical protein DICPUDRAFT_97940 [Dictyostelium purpureum]
MDLYCQKCCKQLELDDSLLDIDTSIFFNQDLSSIAKQIEPFTFTLPKEREIEIFKQQKEQQRELELAALQSPSQQQKEQNSSKIFKVFSKKRDSQISASVPSSTNLSNSTTIPTAAAATTTTVATNATPSNISNSPTSTPTSPIGVKVNATNSDDKKAFKTFYPSTHSSNSEHSGGSPSSPSTFGSLSHHRISASLSSRSLQNNGIASSSPPKSSTTPTNNTISDNTGKTPPTSSSPSLSNSTSKSISSSPNRITSPIINNRSSSNITSPKPSTPKQRPTTMTPNKINITQVTSPQKPKLKYLRSSSKSLSMASLPNLPSDDLNNNNNNNNENNYLSQSTIPIGSPIQTTPPLAGTTTSNSLPNNQLINNMNISVNNLNISTNSTISNSNNLNNSLAGNQNNYLKYMKGSQLFKITTELIHYDLPLCLECTKLTISEIEDETLMLDGEISIYNTYLQRLENQKTNEQIEQINGELDELECEEHNLRQFIQDTYKEREDVEILTNQLQEKRSQLKSLEDGYWSSFSELHYEAFKNQDEREQTAVQIQWINEHLESLKQTNILNDAFHLWHDGHFGTINSLRLGKLPSQPVEWNEINAAWGLTIFLLDNIAKKLKYKFKQYTLVPNGSCSRIEKRDDPSAASYELFGSNDISLGLLFWYRRFDSGMIAFLHCIKELVEFIVEKEPEFTIPYQIEKDLINGTSIKMQFTNDDTWTKSLKYMLTNLKWILVWVTKYESQLSHNNYQKNQQKINQSNQPQPQPPPQQQQNSVNKK